MTSSHTPLISIVIASLNHGQFLDHALRSVLAQRFPRVELIVMDGGSRDGSVGLLEKYDAAISYWSSRTDNGPADALNQGFARATGDILGFLNADDFYLDGAFARIADGFARAPSIDVLSGHGYFALPSGDLGAPMYSDRWNLTRFRYGACVLLQPATFFRRTAYERAGGFRQTGRVCWDMELWADLAASGATFGRIDAFLAAFRLHDASLTGGIRHRRQRRDDARAVMVEVRGRPEGLMDRACEVFFRVLKFTRHPVRNARRRLFFFSTLKRWSL